MGKNSEENKKLKEGYKERDRVKAEIIESKDFQEFMGLKSVFLLGGEKERANFLLFKLNKNLERIADSLDAIFLKM